MPSTPCIHLNLNEPQFSWNKEEGSHPSIFSTQCRFPKRVVLLIKFPAPSKKHSAQHFYLPSCLYQDPRFFCYCKPSSKPLCLTFYYHCTSAYFGGGATNGIPPEEEQVVAPEGVTLIGHRWVEQRELSQRVYIWDFFIKTPGNFNSFQFNVIFESTINQVL